MAESNGKKAEKKIREWLDKPEDGYSFDRLPDQLGGFYGGRNICDFTCFKSPYMFYIESKSTEHDRFDFSQISEFQNVGLTQKNSIHNVYGIVVVLFILHQRAFIFDIADINHCVSQGKKSVNIKKIDKWEMPYAEIPTIPSRKFMLDYEGDLVDLLYFEHML